MSHSRASTTGVSNTHLTIETTKAKCPSTHQSTSSRDSRDRHTQRHHHCVKTHIKKQDGIVKSFKIREDIGKDQYVRCSHDPASGHGHITELYNSDASSAGRFRHHDDGESSVTTSHECCDSPITAISTEDYLSEGHSSEGYPSEIDEPEGNGSSRNIAAVDNDNTPREGTNLQGVTSSNQRSQQSPISASERASDDEDDPLNGGRQNLEAG